MTEHIKRYINSKIREMAKLNADSIYEVETSKVYEWFNSIADMLDEKND